jgi:hypothetical protein
MLCSLRDDLLRNFDFVFRQAIQVIDQPVDFALKMGDIRVWGLFLCGKDAINERDNSRLLTRADVRDWQLLPVVRVKMNVAATVGSKESSLNLALAKS